MRKIFFLTVILFTFLLIKSTVAKDGRDSLIRVISAVKEDTNKVNAFIALSWEFENKKPDTSIALSLQALNLAEKLNWETGIGKSYHQLGRINWLKGKLFISLEYYRKALSVWEKLEASSPFNNQLFIKNNKSKTIGNIGIIYQDQGDNPKALNYYFKALKMAEEIDNRSLISYMLSNIGTVYSDQGDSEKALNFYYKALKIDEDLGNKTEVAITLGNIGIIYHDQGNYNKALDYYSRVLKVAEENENKSAMPMWLGNMGLVYDEQGDYSNAFNYYFKALKMAEEFGDAVGIAFLQGAIGSLYFEKGEYEKAEDYLKRALALSYKMGTLKQTMQDEKFISELYSKTGRDILALEHYKKHILAKDSIYNVENSKKNIRAAINYEFEKKQALQKAAHEKKVLAFEAESIIQKQLRVFLFIIIGLALLILIFVNRAYRSKKKHAKFLAAEDERKELLLEEVHHRINNNLQIISSLLSLQANSANDERLYEYLQQSQNRIQSLAALHELLYQNKTTLEINMNEYIDKVLSFHREVAGTLSAKVVVKTQVPSVNFPATTAVPLALVINELVTNSIKYAFEERDNGEINVTLAPVKNDKNKWKLNVSDNGKGLPPENEKRRNSLGLRLVNILTSQIGATVNTLSSHGAMYEIVFNLKP